MKTCPVCHKTKSKRGREFTSDSLRDHMRVTHPRQYVAQHSREYHHHALEMAEMIAGDESDGVFWGIAFEHGYFG